MQTYTHALTWKRCSDELPDCDIEVLTARRDEPEVCVAYLCDQMPDGSPIFAHVNSGLPFSGVYAWADLPAAPVCLDNLPKKGA